MSLIFEHQGKTIWNPSSRIGNLFIEQIRALETIFEVPSGISNPQNDEAQIDVSQLRSFIFVLSHELEATQNLTSQSLVNGIFSIASGLEAMCAAPHLELQGLCLSAASR